MGENYDLSTIFSAVITFGVLMFIVRIFIYRASKKRTNIVRPDWLKDRRG